MVKPQAIGCAEIVTVDVALIVGSGIDGGDGRVACEREDLPGEGGRTRVVAVFAPTDDVTVLVVPAGVGGVHRRTGLGGNGSR